MVFVFLFPSAWAVDASVWAELGKVQHLQARFTQVQTRKVLKQPLQSSGALDFVRPDGLTWTVDPPYASTFSLKAGIARMDYPALGMSQTIDLNSVPDANRLATSLMVWLQADAAQVERQFDVRYETDGATLSPKDATLRGLIQSIELDLAPSPWRVSGVVLTEPDGDRTELRFRSVVADGKSLPDPG